MEKNNFELLSKLLSEKQFRKLKEELVKLNEADIAEFITEIEPKSTVIVFRMLSKEAAAEVFSYLDTDIQQLIVVSISETELTEIMEELSVDDAVDMLGEMPANIVNRVLSYVKPDKRATINSFLQYPENSAGSVMTSEFVRLKQNMTVREAIDHIRQNGINRETVYTCYVTDASRVLEGVISLRDLLVSANTDIVGEIMERNIVFVTTSDDVETVAETIRKYNFTALPVTDTEKRLVGIVTVDDAVDILTEEATEDFEKMAAMHPSEKSYLKSGVFEIAKNRILWLFILMFSASISGGIMYKYSALYTAFPLLVSFTPMLMGTGGNAGSQSSTTIIRGMSLNEITEADYLKAVLKEITVSLIVGAVLGVFNFLRILLMHPGNAGIAFVVAVSLLVTVVCAKFTGAVLPIVAKKLKLDPALMAAPIVTTIVDATSLSTYFIIASKILVSL